VQSDRHSLAACLAGFITAVLREATKEKRTALAESRTAVTRTALFRLLAQDGPFAECLSK
jgi:hypothetical protein